VLAAVPGFAFGHGNQAGQLRQSVLGGDSFQRSRQIENIAADFLLLLLFVVGFSLSVERFACDMDPILPKEEQKHYAYAPHTPARQD